MPKAYVTLHDLVAAFVDNGSRSEGYVWRALAEHDAGFAWYRPLPGGFTPKAVTAHRKYREELLAGNQPPFPFGLFEELLPRNRPRFPFGMFEDNAFGDLMPAGTVGFGIRSWRDERFFSQHEPAWAPGPNVRSPQAYVDDVWVHKAKLDLWCDAHRVTSPFKGNKRTPAGYSAGPLVLEDLPEGAFTPLPDYGAADAEARARDALRGWARAFCFVVEWCDRVRVRPRTEDRSGSAGVTLGDVLFELTGRKASTTVLTALRAKHAPHWPGPGNASVAPLDRSNAKLLVAAFQADPDPG